MSRFLVGLISLLLINFTLAFDYVAFLAKVKDSNTGKITAAKYLPPQEELTGEVAAWQANHKAAFEKYITKDIKQKELLGTPQKYVIAFVGSKDSVVMKISGSTATFVQIDVSKPIGSRNTNEAADIVKFADGLFAACGFSPSRPLFFANAIRYGYPALQSLGDTPVLEGGEGALALMKQLETELKKNAMTNVYVLRSGPPKFVASWIETRQGTNIIAGNSKITLYVGSKKLAEATCSKHSKKTRKELYIEEGQEDANGQKFADEIIALCALPEADGKCEGNKARTLYISGEIAAGAKAAIFTSNPELFSTASARSQYSNYYPQDHHNKYDRYMNRLKRNRYYN